MLFIEMGGKKITTLYISIFSSVWDGGGDAFESRNPLVKGVDGFQTIKGRVDQSEI